MVVSTAEETASLRCPPITYLLRCVTWDTRHLRFDLFKVNLTTYLSLSEIDPNVFHGLEDSGVYAKWWTWPDDGPGDGKRFPGWWSDPSVDVVSQFPRSLAQETCLQRNHQGAPMPVFESDKDDLSSTAGEVYICLRHMSAEKESNLRGIDDRIAEEELEFSR